MQKGRRWHLFGMLAVAGLPEPGVPLPPLVVLTMSTTWCWLFAACLHSENAAPAPLPAAFIAQVHRANRATRPAVLRRAYRQWLVRDGNTWLYARAQARAMQYDALPTFVLAPAASADVSPQNVLARLRVSPAKHLTSAVLYTGRGFVGYLDCESKALGYLAYCSGDTTKEYLVDVAQAWNRLQRAQPSFAFMVQGFRNCVFFLKDGEAYVTVLGNGAVYPLASFLRAFCAASALRKGYHYAGDAFLY